MSEQFKEYLVTLDLSSWYGEKTIRARNIEEAMTKAKSMTLKDVDLIDSFDPVLLPQHIRVADEGEELEFTPTYAE